MGDNKTGVNDHYRVNTKFLVRDYNKLFPLPYYFRDMVWRHGTYHVADLGAGPVCRLGGKFAGSNIIIHASDCYAKEYNELTSTLCEELLIPIEYQDMEQLTYANESFDIVHCVNALDHTRDARKALEEMKRVCKKGGWIYLRHSPNQMSQLHGDHYWDATMQGLSNGKELIKMDGFKIGTDGFMIIYLMNKL